MGTRDIAEQLNAQAVNGKIVSLDNMIDKSRDERETFDRIT